MSHNRLSKETSPYLLQHKDNPVHWWAWGPEALQEANNTNKPILLSIGYAACHWCHVMAHESFEDQETADIMNALFVNIKVDREERPDIDTIYMSALHKLGEQGGWPLTMFLTSTAEPFWGGTYFPKTALYGRPAFSTVLQRVAQVYNDENETVVQNVNAIGAALREKPIPGPEVDINEPTLSGLALRFTEVIDPEYGGMSGAPKFPQVKFFEFIWRAGLRFNLSPCTRSIENTLTHICQGGIYDHLGGGFARYSVDERWLVPHFEKMLYDNAQLIDILTEAWRETQNPLYAVRIEETVDWLFREMITTDGAFASSLDADSEGEEGKFYVWSKHEIDHALGGEDAEFFCQIYDVHEDGNWEGKTILSRLHTLELLSEEDEARLKALRDKLLKKRAERIRPGWDDKVLTDWNGLMIAALAKAGWVFDRADWIGAAERALAFIETKMTRDGRFFHSYRADKLTGAAIANDFANMIAAALSLFQITRNNDYLNKAVIWTDTLNKHYWDQESGGYYFTADDTDDLILRTKIATDDSTPNANGIMATCLTSLYLITGNEKYRTFSQDILAAFQVDLSRNLVSHTGLLAATFDLINPTHIVIVSPDDADEIDIIDKIKKKSIPGAVIQIISQDEELPDTSPAHGKSLVDSRATAYVCIGPKCSQPITHPEEVLESLKHLSRPHAT